jgi:hypothetical protein
LQEDTWWTAHVPSDTVPDRSPFEVLEQHQCALEHDVHDLRNARDGPGTGSQQLSALIWSLVAHGSRSDVILVLCCDEPFAFRG